MDKSTTLLTCAVACGVYAAQTLLAPATWLEPNKMPVNDDTIMITRAAGGGIFGLATLSYLAKGSGAETQDVALKALCAATCVYTAVNISSNNGTMQKKMDIATSVVLTGLTASAIMQ
jgi:hypothetical protein